MLNLPVRPPFSLGEILFYTFLSFAIALALTPWFIGFLRRYKLGKQLRVEAVDGGSASVFLTYHKSKAGTPTMGGLLIWGSILITVLLSRALSFSGTLDTSLLQRGQVYLPLAMMVCFGILGAADDYLNIVGSDEVQIGKIMPRIKGVIATLLLLAIGGIGFILWRSYGALSPLQHFSRLPASIAIEVSVLAIIVFLAVGGLLLLALGGKFVDRSMYKLLISQGKRRGLNARPKLFILIAMSSLAAYWFYVRLGNHTLHIPFASALHLPMTVDLGLWYIPFVIFVLIGTANAVNVTDGLDGLAGGLLIAAFGAFGVIAYVSGLYVLAGFCGVVAGAIAAFLWHNVPPAMFFMGDTGSLALGGTLAVMAFMIDRVLVLPLIGFVFVIEMLSVIIQLTSKRLRNGKKVFKSAPFHHHLEALEWGESKVTMRLWIIGAFAALLGVLVGIYG
ncbi:MAG TPA: phospho-N-acetylmuramoyl-pentapeptide-transferase [Candidatus Peribacteria bacterium]|nr:phospho-N-acetylmuramoyl-pentapeptide-transferase [Candidatus Peribacteria bacterium]